MSSQALPMTALVTISEVWLKEKARPVVVDDANEYRYDARELHDFLEIQTKFGNWFPREVARHNLLEGNDFVRIQELRREHSNDVSAIGRRPIDHLVVPLAGC
jgi:AntA/AntB antirepressor